MISTGGSMLRAAEACRQRGAKAIYAMATHGVFSKGAEAILAHPAVDGTIVTRHTGCLNIACNRASRSSRVRRLSPRPFAGSPPAAP